MLGPAQDRRKLRFLFSILSDAPPSHLSHSPRSNGDVGTQGRPVLRAKRGSIGRLKTIRRVERPVRRTARITEERGA